jgi:hypothetical protein
VGEVREELEEALRVQPDPVPWTDAFAIDPLDLKAQDQTPVGAPAPESMASQAAP